MPGKHGTFGVLLNALPIGLLCLGAVAGTFAAAGGAYAADPQPAPQARAAAPTPPPTGTATLTIQAVASDSGAPVKGAHLAVLWVPVQQQPARTQTAPALSVDVSAIIDGVSARDTGQAPPRVVKEGRTDQAGAVAFTALPAGLYSISVTPPAAFVRGQPPPPVQVNNGANAKAVIQLDRGGVITGRVFDEDGEPVTGARLAAFRQEKTAGSARPASYGSSEATDDLGQFRVWALPAGDYLVSASFSDYARTPGEDSGVRDGHLPTFFPGVAAFDAARPVVVKIGQETGGVDFPLVLGRLGTVSGRATDSAGNPLSSVVGINASVSLASRGPNPVFGGRGGPVRPDGSFIISGVPPGDYYLSASRMRSGQPNAPREGAYVPVSVNGDEVTVNIQTNFGATISGRVDFEGTAPAAQPGAPGSQSRTTPTRVGVSPATSGGYGIAFASSSPAAVRPDGTFEVTGVRGLVHIMAQGGRGALKAVRRGGRDISGQPLELLGTERVDDIVVVMTEETGRIDGVVADEHGEPVSGAVVVIFPDDPARWSAGSPFVRQSRTVTRDVGESGPSVPAGSSPAAATRAPLAPGAFSVAMLPAGRYAVVALPASAGYLHPERQALERWRESATIVTVEAWQTETVKLTPVR